MDRQLLQVLRYADDRSRETLEMYQQGKLTEKQACIRSFLLGKSLIGWPNEDDRPDYEIMQELIAANKAVMESVDESARVMAS